MNAPIFFLDGVPHRIVGEIRRDKDAAFNEARYNLLQRGYTGVTPGRVYWETKAEERVPDHAVLSLACFGDAGGWRSSLPAEGFAAVARCKGEKA